MVEIVNDLHDSYKFVLGQDKLKFFIYFLKIQGAVRTTALMLCLFTLISTTFHAESKYDNENLNLKKKMNRLHFFAYKSGVEREREREKKKTWPQIKLSKYDNLYIHCPFPAYKQLFICWDVLWDFWQKVISDILDETEFLAGIKITRKVKYF